MDLRLNSEWTCIVKNVNIDILKNVDIGLFSVYVFGVIPKFQ